MISSSVLECSRVFWSQVYVFVDFIYLIIIFHHKYPAQSWSRNNKKKEIVKSKWQGEKAFPSANFLLASKVWRLEVNGSTGNTLWNILGRANVTSNETFILFGASSCYSKSGSPKVFVFYFIIANSSVAQSTSLWSLSFFSSLLNFFQIHQSGLRRVSSTMVLNHIHYYFLIWCYVLYARLL